MREGMGLIASSTCFGPIPLRCDFWGLRGIGPALAEEALGSKSFRAVREGILLFASKARCGPIPLRLGVFWRSAGSVLRSLRKLEEGSTFRAAREGICCSLPMLAPALTRCRR